MGVEVLAWAAMSGQESVLDVSVARDVGVVNVVL